ncbi:MAG: methyltransferase domain-containing protein [Candidatus Thermoplasmatota archaeon]|nr:methyltransferase domain-containing protein [Candidatus Thermoplasmatota archaeon]
MKNERESVAACKQEWERVMREIWTGINVRQLKVLAVGVGENAASARWLLGQGANVTAIDKEIEKLKKYKTLGIPLVCCDVNSLVFKDGSFDLCVFSTVLHEIDPSLHEKILSKTANLSSRIMIIEHSPRTFYERYEKLWRNAMRQIGKFEERRPFSYWKELVKKCDLKILISKRIERKKKLLPKKVSDISTAISRKWAADGVPKKYIEEMRSLSLI